MRQANPNKAPDPKMLAQFRQENAALLQRQRELAPILAQQGRSPFAASSSFQIPQYASPQMAAYLTERNLLMRDQNTVMDQHRTDPPLARQAALQQWRQQNVVRLEQLQQEAQALTQNLSPAPAVVTTATSK